MENWKSIPGYEGVYSVSDAGRVRSEPRLVAHIGAGKTLKGRIVLARINRATGYPAVNLSINNIRRTFTVHQLVALAFLGARPSGYQVAHRDGDRMNPTLSNIRYATAVENAADKIGHGTHARGERCRHARLTEDQVRAIRVDVRPQRQRAAIYGVSEATISRVVHRLDWAWVA